MKNIHILPTDKPSRLLKTIPKGNLILSKSITSGSHWENQNIYITSDEEIKEGDWCYQVELNDGKVDKCYDVTLYHTWTNNGVDKTRKFKKIIITTDPELIKDGVQAIDDEFLEWFVKNPSCEEVEVIHGLFNPMGRQVDSMNLGQNHSQCVWKYKIIIPQKELSKDEIDREFIEEAFKSKEEPKQETLEEVAAKYGNTEYPIPYGYVGSANDFIKGAKWQAKRMYSEEEVIKIVEKSRETGLTAEYLMLKLKEDK